MSFVVTSFVKWCVLWNAVINVVAFQWNEMLLYCVVVKILNIFVWSSWELNTAINNLQYSTQSFFLFLKILFFFLNWIKTLLPFELVDSHVVYMWITECDFECKHLEAKVEKNGTVHTSKQKWSKTNGMEPSVAQEMIPQKSYSRFDIRQLSIWPQDHYRL